MTSRDLKLQFSYELLKRLLVKDVSWKGWLEELALANPSSIFNFGERKGNSIFAE